MRAIATIDRAALTHNLEKARALAPGRAVYAAVKADAYGHGAATATMAMDKADGFLVSSMEEAMQLRWSGVTQPIVTLSQPLSEEVCRSAVEHDIRLVIFDQADLEVLENRTGAPVSVWVKIDSGMHRLGFAPDRAGDIETQLSKLSSVNRLGWLTHLGCADELDNERTHSQVAIFNTAVEGLEGKRSIANSAGLLAWPSTQADMMRPGIMLYGCSPIVGTTAADYGLKPAMHLTAPIISRRRVAAGEPIGYGATWYAPEDMDVGVIGIGYGDGYPRHAPSGTPVLVHDKRSMLLGRVSMDMMTIDLRGIPEARVADRVTLWGEGLPVEEVSAACQTIAHELFCQLTARVHFRIV